MQKVFAHGILAAALVASGSPMALAQQQGVQLYGTADVFLYSKQLAGTSQMSRVDSGGMTTSFWGIRSTEDLGGGYSAVADFAGFFQIDNGGAQRSATDSGGFFGKYAWVGLASSDYGTVRFGRQTTPTFLNTVRFEPTGGSSTFGMASHLYLPSALVSMLTANGSVGTTPSGTAAGADSAWNNSIGYVSPTVGGLRGMALYSLAEGSAAPAAGKRSSLGVWYANGPLDIGLSADRIDDASATLVRTATDPAGAPYVLNQLRTVQVGASYDFNVVKLFAQYNQSRLGLASVAEVQLDTTQLGASVPVGAGRVMASWMRTTREQVAQTDKARSTISIGYDYNLSKRTDLYAVLMNDRATGLDQGNGLGLGVRHKF